jgi:hypothetical protein
MKKLLNKKPLVAAIVLTSLILLLIAVTSALLYYKNKLNHEFTNSYPVSYVPSYPVSEITNEENSCLKTYYNGFFPTFSFDYDSCYWTIDEETAKVNTASEVEFPLNHNIYLIDGFNNRLQFNLFTPIPFGFASETSCYSNEIVNINDKYVRITTDNLRYTYLLKSMIIENGTEEFNTIKQSPPSNYTGLPINKETRFCLQPNIEMGFRVNYSANDLGEGNKFNNPDSDLATFFNIYLDIQSNAETKLSADAIVNSLNY